MTEDLIYPFVEAVGWMMINIKMFTESIVDYNNLSHAIPFNNVVIIIYLFNLKDANYNLIN